MLLKRLIVTLLAALIVSGCAPYTRMPELGQREDSEVVLMIARGESYVPSVGGTVGIILREVDGVGLPVLGIGSPATQLLPGKRILSGTLETPPKLGAITVIRSKQFSIETELEPGWVYFLLLEQKQEFLDVNVRKFCQSSDHRRTFSLLVEQKLFYADTALSDLKCE